MKELMEVNGNIKIPNNELCKLGRHGYHCLEIDILKSDQELAIMKTIMYPRLFN
jgi:hypothetical protein